jgi:hypothetical protein
MTTDTADDRARLAEQQAFIAQLWMDILALAIEERDQRRAARADAEMHLPAEQPVRYGPRSWDVWVPGQGWRPKR